jgi:hypothetical protein
VGDRTDWSFPWSLYAGYALHYILTGAAVIRVDMVELPTGVFSASLPSSVTSALTPGQYAWVLAGVKDGDRYTLAQGVVDIDVDISLVATPIDLRTHARKVLDAIESVLEGRATADADQLMIHQRRIVKTPIPDLLKFRDRYKAEVAREDALAGRTPFMNKIFVRFER